jgi:NAD(P)H dehydrogenase (quinone)
VRVLVVYAHPVEESFVSALHQCVVTALRAAGHEVDDCDLYREGFSPVLTGAERRAYHDVAANRTIAPKDVERLRWCEALVLVFPTWWYGMPAMLKGYIDRVWLPGVAFTLDNGRTRPALHNIKRFAAVTTYGSPWWLNKLMGDPSRRVFMRGIRLLFAAGARVDWHAQYGMDSADAATRERFLRKIEQVMRDF